MTQLFYFPGYQAVSASGTPLAGAKLSFFFTGTTTAAPVYADAARTVVLSNPIVADSLGRFPQLYPDPKVVYRARLSDASNVQQWQEDGSSPQLFPRTDAEIAGTLTPANCGHTAIPIDVMRFGIVPNDSSPAARSANSASLKALLSSNSIGPVGRLFFPPISGSDTYYFDDFFPSRDGIMFDGMYCTLDFARTYVAADNQTAFFYFIRNSGIENATIVINYDGSAGVHAGNAIRIGNRESAGNYFKFGFEDALSVPMGNITLRNLRIRTNNPHNDGVILMLGGMRNVVMENVTIDGGNASNYGILCEFGTFSTNGSPNNDDLWSSAHPSALIFRNIRVSNLSTTSPPGGPFEGAGIALIGAYQAIVDNLHVENAYQGFECRAGEALFHSPAPYDDTGARHCISLRNIVANVTNTGVVFKGTEPATGYLATAGITPHEQVDLVRFFVEGFSIKAGIGMRVSGPCIIMNGTIRDASSSGGLVIDDECVQFDINGVNILDGAGDGIRAAGTSAAIISPPRKKIGTIRNCLIAGNAGFGILMGTSTSVLIENNRLGYNVAYDPDGENVQTRGVAIAADGAGIACRGNFVSVATNGTAYTSAGTGDRGNSIWNARGDVSNTAEMFAIDGLVEVLMDTSIVKLSAAINAYDKYAGKLIWDATNKRSLRARGPNPADPWDVTGGGGAVTPNVP